MKPDTYDFSGYATRNDTECADGRVIRRNAFQDCDGVTVPLVWAHQHDSVNNVLGHAYLENREDGVYAYGVFNNTEGGQNAKEQVRNGDIRAMSIYANKLKQLGRDVMHGVIREVSLVLAPANPGAYIDSIVCHSYDGDDSELSQEAYICFPENIELYHSDDYDDEYDYDDYDEDDEDYDDGLVHLSELYHSDDYDDEDYDDYDEDDGDYDDYDEDDEDYDYDDEDYDDGLVHLSELYHSATVADVLSTLTPLQMNVVEALIAEALMQN